MTSYIYAVVKICSVMRKPRILVRAWSLLLPFMLFSWNAQTVVSMSDSELVARLEKSLLSAFGMNERPHIAEDEKINVHPYMFQLYNERLRRQSKETSNEETQLPVTLESDTANAVRSFTHIEREDDRFYAPHRMVLHFNVSSVPTRDLLRGADLIVSHERHPSLAPIKLENLADSKQTKKPLRRWSKGDSGFLQRLYVHDVIRPARGSTHAVHRLLDTRLIDARENGSIRLDVSSSIKRWLKKPHTNYGLVIEVIPIRKNTSYNDTTHVRLRRDVSLGETPDLKWTEKQPLLLVHTDSERIKSREKRNAAVATYKRPHCRRYSMYVDFRKVNWSSWIVAPPGYDAFFCQGECPYPLADHMNATNHAVIQNLIHSKYPARVPSSCCVPIKHSAISMLYLDKDRKVVLETYQDMVVESCGCQ